MQIREREELAGFLRKGDIAKIASIASVHRNSVENYIKGRVKKSIVEKYFLKVVDQRKKELDKVVEKTIQP